VSTELDWIANPPLVAAMLAADDAAVAQTLPHATLVLPAAGTAGEGAVLTPSRGPGGSRLQPAFTDVEALKSWDRHPAPAAIAIPVSQLGALVSPGSAALLLNPAGPGTYLVGGDALRRPFPDTTLHPNGATNVLVDPAGRRQLRTEARSAHDAGCAARAAGRLQVAVQELSRGLDACTQLGDRLHGAATAVELAQCRLQSGAAADALELFAAAGETFALLGEMDLAVSALLDGAQAALSGADPDPERAEQLSVLALNLVAGTDVSDRIVSLWKRLS
jgi:hypothetical protein